MTNAPAALRRWTPLVNQPQEQLGCKPINQSDHCPLKKRLSSSLCSSVEVLDLPGNKSFSEANTRDLRSGRNIKLYAFFCFSSELGLLFKLLRDYTDEAQMSLLSSTYFKS